MNTLLHIASSSNLINSVTRQVGSEIIQSMKSVDPTLHIIERDLAKNPAPHLSPAVIDVFYQAGASQLALSDKLVDELLASHYVLIEAPMHNFSIPSVTMTDSEITYA